MTCYSPLSGFRAAAINDDTRKRGIVFNPLKAANSTNLISFPCGKCWGCRLDCSEAWAIRCVHEAQMHEHNSFITLTFNKDHLPEDYSVNVRTWQLFMKRLRQEVDVPLRFFACGEYGSENLRPHYHALINGCDFSDDRKHLYDGEYGPIYTSERLAKVWPYGSRDRQRDLQVGPLRRGLHLQEDHWRPCGVSLHPHASGLRCCRHRRAGILRTEPSSWHRLHMVRQVSRRLFPVGFPRHRRTASAGPALLPAQARRAGATAHPSEAQAQVAPHKWNKTPERLAVREFIKRSRTNSFARTKL